MIDVTGKRRDAEKAGPRVASWGRRDVIAWPAAFCQAGGAALGAASDASWQRAQNLAPGKYVFPFCFVAQGARHSFVCLLLDSALVCSSRGWFLLAGAFPCTTLPSLTQSGTEMCPGCYRPLFEFHLSREACKHRGEEGEYCF